MKKIVINGGKELSGVINVSGAKNSVVALIPAAILTEGTVKIFNTPVLSDTENLKRIITLLGGDIHFGHGEMVINSKNVKNSPIPADLSVKLRASYYFMGALLARFKRVEMHFPGGCKIGARPIDLHLKAFKKMGATVVYENDKYTISAEELHGSDIYLDFPSVGATVNIMLAASLAKGITKIENAAKEPEIINLATLLSNMGVNVLGAGTDTITICGVTKLGDAVVDVIPDRIEAGTYVMIGALAGKNLKINNLIPEHLDTLTAKLRDMSANFEIGEDYITLNKVQKLEPANIKTLVYPGFPTDLGQPMSVLLTQAMGTSNFEETIYESRVGHIPELIKMGANIDYTNNTAKIVGKTDLKGCEVSSTDLRAGAALIIAGLIADGQTKILNIEYILRGYEDIVKKLTSVGADIKIIEE